MIPILLLTLLTFSESRRISTRHLRASHLHRQVSNFDLVKLPVTVSQMQQLGWNQTQAEVGELNAALRRYNIVTLQSLLHFLSQTSQESLCGYFKEEIADGSQYEGMTIYGNTQPGDGKKFKAAGYLGLTGRKNYNFLSKSLSDSRVMTGHSYVAQHLPWTSAAFLWNYNGLNTLCANGATVEQVTKKILGTYTGLQSRKQYYNKAKKIFTKLDVI